MVTGLASTATANWDSTSSLATMDTESRTFGLLGRRSNSSAFAKVSLIGTNNSQLA